MIVENIITSVSLDTTHKMNLLNPIDFKYFNAYAKYLLDNKLDELAKAQLAFSQEIKLPLLKFFEHLTEKELILIGIEGVTELLNYCAANKADEYINLSVEKWMNNQLPFVAKNQVLAEDISSVGFMRRRLFRHFITSYTTDIESALKILYEADLFTSKMDAVCFNVLIKMQQQLFAQSQLL